MPTYRYQCAKCGEQFELWQSIHDEGLTRHPGCGGKVTKVMAPAGIVLKGSGFYRNDSRAGGRKGGSKEKEPAKEGAAGNGSGAEATSASESKDSGNSKGSKESKSSKNSKTSQEAKPSKSGSSST